MSESTMLGRFAPVTRAEAAAVQGGPGAPASGQGAPASPVAPALAPAPVPVSPAAIPAPAPAPTGPRYVGGPPREDAVPLHTFIEHEGVLWTEIPLRRPSSAEVGQYFERLSKVGPEQSLFFPVFAKPDGTRVPDEVLRFLDDDDKQRVMARAEDFLPLRLLALLDAQQPASPPTDGANTEPTSST